MTHATAAQEAATIRDLTTLEYVILSLLAIAPQSGYSLLNQLETGLYRIGASTGSVYPVLKRLEKADLIASILEGESETRPRKVYMLRPSGSERLDGWLRQAPEMSEVIEQFSLALHKFFIAEYRLSRAEVLEWLTAYETVTRAALAMRKIIAASSGPTMPIATVTHAELVNQALQAEVEARLAWITAAQSRLQDE